MVSPKAKCMTAGQRSTVNAALNAAFDEGICFESLNAVQEYLKDLLSEDLIGSFGNDIFDCYLRLKASRGRQLLSPSTEGSQLNTSETSLEADDRSDKSDTVAPMFVTEEVRRP